LIRPRYHINDRIITDSSDYDGELGVIVRSFISEHPYNGDLIFSYEVILDCRSNAPLVFAEFELLSAGITTPDLILILEEIATL